MRGANIRNNVGELKKPTTIPSNSMVSLRVILYCRGLTRLGVCSREPLLYADRLVALRNGDLDRLPATKPHLDCERNFERQFKVKIL